MIYLTSDTHFCHDKEFLYKPRGFSSIEEHDKKIISNWNSVIKQDDEVYHLGDVMLVDNEKGAEYLSQLNGKIHIILGNHCTNTRIEIYKKLKNIQDIQYAYMLKYKKAHFYLSHYPTLTANFDDGPWHKNIISLHGHTHSKEKFYDENNPFIYNVALDAHNCFPVSLDQIIEDIKQKKEKLTNNEIFDNINKKGDN